ncbi:uncharacterized protein [Palaemon carinicauda]|uniref:uncharacterized protein n=1 Tax=Palaemon carinicauda TaxID=392227 RepID=UPI0035B61EF6
MVTRLRCVRLNRQQIKRQALAFVEMLISILHVDDDSHNEDCEVNQDALGHMRSVRPQLPLREDTFVLSTNRIFSGSTMSKQEVRSSTLVFLSLLLLLLVTISKAKPQENLKEFHKIVFPADIDGDKERAEVITPPCFCKPCEFVLRQRPCTCKEVFGCDLAARIGPPVPGGSLDAVA